jgi:hypothetical protein
MPDPGTPAPADTDDTRAEMAARFAELEQDQPDEQDPQDTAADTAADNDGAPEGTSAGTEDATEDAPVGDESFTNFRIEDVPEEHREYVEKAYKQLQGDYTRKTQSLAQERQEAENAMAFIAALQSEDQRADALRQIAQAYGGEQALLDILGYETEEPDLDTEPFDEDIDPDDPNAAMRAEWEQFKAFQAQQLAAQEEAEAAKAEEEHLDRIDQSVTDQLSALAKQHGEISPEEEQLLIGHALANPPDENGFPRLAAAYDALQASYSARQQRWAKSKETTHVAPDGQAATQVPDLDNERERRDHLAAAIAAHDAAIPGN